MIAEDHSLFRRVRGPAGDCLRHGDVIGHRQAVSFKASLSGHRRALFSHPLGRVIRRLSMSNAVRMSRSAGRISGDFAGIVAASQARPASQTTTTTAQRGANTAAASRKASSDAGCPSKPMITGPECIAPRR